ncbi:hypothetical protein [Mucilaginibacter gotjawali]|uniref:Uncharacterized protein n=2 Tax=Mucilaginibacter gotjawali TaxID=1550579 RepID=A0A110B012_9SPHI|nr:hypothetical protein [Mucilaginibacter gotjawali]MBB3058112.1 hypothetical protein [Mucilaginibacter gotjawali]BAU52087.1 hypothetical protein MgSA37_00237 [Mucilaginibacter gotjawali]
MEFIAGVIDQIPNISVITEIEALSWISPDIRKEKIIGEFVKDSNVLWLTPAIVKQCVKIRRGKKLILQVQL